MFKAGFLYGAFRVRGGQRRQRWGYTGSTTLNRWSEGLHVIRRAVGWNVVNSSALQIFGGTAVVIEMVESIQIGCRVMIARGVGSGTVWHRGRAEAGRAVVHGPQGQVATAAFVALLAEVVILALDVADPVVAPFPASSAID